MALSGLDIYKLLPKSNCRECGFATCLAFAMQLAKKAVSIDKCPHLTPEAKNSLEASSLPPIRLVSFGKDPYRVEEGNETVLFRHEEKFHHPTALGFIINDDSNNEEINKKLSEIHKLRFERVGQIIEANIVALRQRSSAERFIEALKFILSNSELAVVLMVKDAGVLDSAAQLTKERTPLVYPLSANLPDFAQAAIKHKLPLVVRADSLDRLCEMTKDLNNKGLNDLILEINNKSIARQIWDLTSIRRLALKKGQRCLGYPTISVIEKSDDYEEIMRSATNILKYGNIILTECMQNWQILSLLTLRQNIYTDPQKPLQIEPKLYSIGQVTKDSPLLITTNFSLTYYTVLGEVEASKIPTYIMSVDTEGMSVLTAWAAEKFTSDKIVESLNKFGAVDTVSHSQMIIPGYVAVISGDLEEKSKWKVVVGPKEASGISSFLKNLQSR